MERGTLGGLDPGIQERLREVAAELRTLMYGEQACPAWGTKFAEIESEGMAVGRELSRLLMEQSTQEQTRHMPEDALTVVKAYRSPQVTSNQPTSCSTIA